ncbi:hypothetical protein [Streptomyces griseus]|uniref:hypothetical protein n=1 Tax=Streptomyces griseus TaxID=1911 RepID=UPI00131AFAB6|nr:hypothetical protein [Streptomyces griseus]
MHLNAEELADSSERWMAAAFAAFSQGSSSEGMAVHHAAVATEHLLKAFLARIHPSLIVEGKDFPSLLYAAGRSDLQQVKGSQIKTIQLGEAYARARSLLPAIPPRPKGAAWPLADARNGVAHAGYHDRSEVITVFVSCIKVIDPLLDELGIGARYWGLHQGLHDKLLLEGVEAARVRLEQKLTRARRVFLERYGHIAEEHWEVVLAAIAPVVTPGWIGEYSARVACPACPANGHLLGLSFVDEERATVVLTPHLFECRICELRVEMAELDLLASPLDEDVDLDVPPEDFYAEVAPYEDLELVEGDDEEDGELDYTTRLLTYRKRI